MALTSETKIYNDLFKMSIYLFDLTRKLPKDVKPSLGRRIENTLLDMADLVVDANSRETGEERLRLEDLRTMRKKYERLQFLVNLCVNLRHFSIKQQAAIAVMMTPIGKQLSGWMKHVKMTMGV